MATKPADLPAPLEGPTAAQYRQGNIEVLVVVVGYGIVIFLICFTAKHYHPEWFRHRASCAQGTIEAVVGVA